MCRFIHMHACMHACVVFLCEGFLEKSWSWVNMLWNVNCLHDNSPVSSFRLSSAGFVQPNRVCHGIGPLIDLSYLKKKRDLFIYADFCITSPLTLTGLSPQCLCSRPGLDEERENVCVCLCRSNSAQSFESQLTELWQAFKQRRCSVSHIVNGIVVYVSVFVAEQWSLGGR